MEIKFLDDFLKVILNAELFLVFERIIADFAQIRDARNRV